MQEDQQIDGLTSLTPHLDETVRAPTRHEFEQFVLSFLRDKPNRRATINEIAVASGVSAAVAQTRLSRMRVAYAELAVVDTTTSPTAHGRRPLVYGLVDAAEASVRWAYQHALAKAKILDTLSCIRPRQALTAHVLRLACGLDESMTRTSLEALEDAFLVEESHFDDPTLRRSVSGWALAPGVIVPVADDPAEEALVGEDSPTKAGLDPFSPSFTDPHGYLGQVRMVRVRDHAPPDGRSMQIALVHNLRRRSLRR